MLSALVSRLVAASALVVALAFAVVAPVPALAMLGAAPAILALVVGERWKIDRSLEAAVSFAALAAGAVLPRVFAVDTTNMQHVLSERTLFFVCPMLLLGSVRAVFRAPAYGARGTLTVLLVALAGCGRVKTGLEFPLLVAGFLTVATIALAATDRTRSLPSEGRTRHFAGLALGVLFAGGVTFAIALPLPALHAKLVDRIMSRLGSRSGFGEELTLGDLHGMLMSDRVVARVRNGSPEYLRGAVFASYSNGGWITAPPDEGPSYRQGGEEPTDRSKYVEVEFARKPERYFLPREASDVVASTGSFFENRLGLRWPASAAHWAKRVWYAPSEPAMLAGPAETDRDVNRTLRPKLQAILDEWGIGPPMTAKERVAAIELELKSRYDYSLDYDRTPGVDFVIDFLTTHKRGHCEYFASAFALLVRQAGIPARVVTGFRVSERSPLADYAIVRERNAHSWAEVWLGGRWTTWDPTPADDLASLHSKTPLFGATWDLLSTSWEKVDDFLSARSPFELTLALLALVGLLILVRAVRLRQNLASVPAAIDADPPLDAFIALEQALDAKGLGRPGHETLDAFAARLEAEARTELTPAVEAIRAYAEHRYGGSGDRGRVERTLEEAARAMR